MEERVEAAAKRKKKVRAQLCTMKNPWSCRSSSHAKKLVRRARRLRIRSLRKLRLNRAMAMVPGVMKALKWREIWWSQQSQSKHQMIWSHRCWLQVKSKTRKRWRRATILFIKVGNLLRNEELMRWQLQSMSPPNRKIFANLSKKQSRSVLKSLNQVRGVLAMTTLRSNPLKIRRRLRRWR